MWSYRAPRDDIFFVLEGVLDVVSRWRDIPAFAELDRDSLRDILGQAARFAEETLAPTNARGDIEGCRLGDGAVATPSGFAAAYKVFAAGGWPALACDPAVGGQGLPMVVSAVVYEMLSSANHAWTMYPGILQGACECVSLHATPEIRQRYLPKLVSGAWLSTMCLSEPQAGTDLGLIRTRADPGAGPAANGTPVAITGQKIFISGGDHDLTDNIVHLVLCRLPDAPAGSRGITLVLAPKWLPDGSRNPIRCIGLEHKMGIHGSATCAMAFDAATGWIVGEPNRGLAAMFVMMNAARLHVGLQGLGHLETARQNASLHARERLQMRAIARPPGHAAAPADPIAFHPAIRRALWDVGARTDAARVLACWTAVWLDEAKHREDPESRSRAEAIVGVLTPIVKAFLTDQGHFGADRTLQVFGGYGFLRDFAIEQSVRDSRVTMIYEGTNEVQAIDLLVRKILDNGGVALGGLLAEVEPAAARCAAIAGLADFGIALSDQLARLREATRALAAGRADDPEWPLRVADDYLQASGYVLFAWAWARIALAAWPLSGDPKREARLAAARFGIEWILPDVEPRWRRILRREAALPWIA